MAELAVTLRPHKLEVNHRATLYPNLAEHIARLIHEVHEAFDAIPASITLSLT